MNTYDKEIFVAAWGVICFKTGGRKFIYCTMYSSRVVNAVIDRGMKLEATWVLLGKRTASYCKGGDEEKNVEKVRQVAFQTHIVTITLVPERYSPAMSHCSDFAPQKGSLQAWGRDERRREGKRRYQEDGMAAHIRNNEPGRPVMLRGKCA